MERDTAPTDFAQEPLAASWLNVGFNSAVRNLESLAREASAISQQTEKTDASAFESLKTAIVLACPLSMAHPTLDSMPLLVATASLANKTLEPVRLVEISAKGETAISHALAIPRVGVLALGEYLPGAMPLIHYVRSAVEAIEVPWLKEASGSSYLPLKLETANVPITTKGPRKREPSHSQDD